MTNPKALKIGLIGAGAIVVERHLPGLHLLPGIEIVAVSNSTFESSRAFCDKHLPKATPMKNWAEMLMIGDLDAIWIGTQPYMHSTVTISAIEAGCHVFCQARMAMGLEDGLEMLEAAASRPDLVTMLCPAPHGMKGAAVFKELLASGAIGAPHHVRLRSLSPCFLDADLPAHWRQRRDLSGLNILTLGIYAEVLQDWLGPIVSVSAHGRVVNPVRAGYKVEIPDIALVHCEFASGMLGALEFSGVAAHGGGDCLEVFGSGGTLVYHFSDERILLGDSPDDTLSEVEIPSGRAGLWTVERDFIAAVRDPAAPRPRPDFHEGIRYMRVIQAAADSMASGQRIPTGN